MTSTARGWSVSRSVSVVARGYDKYCSTLFTRLTNSVERRFDARAASFHARLITYGCDPDAHIDVLPEYRLIYICVPKCASTTIKMVLSAMTGYHATLFERIHKRRYSGLKSPSQVGLSTLYRTAVDSSTLRFAFVRNPYDRLVSAWADKFKNRPLVPGDSFIDKYLQHRGAIDSALPAGPQRALSFADFVTFATATAHRRIDAHWQLQDDILNMPGINLDFIGKVESFESDFARVIDHLSHHRPGRSMVIAPLHRSNHQPWPQYYSSTLADRVYRAYERDFDRLRYSRSF